MPIAIRHSGNAALAAAALLLLPAASPADPLAVHAWDARPADPRPAFIRIPRGSAALLEARLPATPGAASFLWQTNGMPDDLWWEAPAECRPGAVRAVWTAAMDPGADEVRAFFRIGQPEGPDYSAFCHIEMLGSPGSAPNALPWPVRRLDFADTPWTNAPWATLADLARATNALVIGAVDLSPYATLGALGEAVSALGAGISEARGAALDAGRLAGAAQDAALTARAAADAALARRAAVVPLAPGWRILARLTDDPALAAHVREAVEAAGGAYSGALSIAGGDAGGPWAAYVDGAYACASLFRSGAALYMAGGDAALVVPDAGDLGLPPAEHPDSGEPEGRVFAVADPGPAGAVVDGAADTPLALNSDLAAVSASAASAGAELEAIRAAADAIELPADPTAAELGAAFRALLLCIRNPARARAALRAARPAPETDR